MIGKSNLKLEQIYKSMRHLIPATLMVLGLLAASSCSDDNTGDPYNPIICIHPVSGGDRVAYTAPNVTAFWHVEDWAGRQILGAGYDPNAAYLSEASVKAPVLDLEKIRAYDENRVQVTEGTEDAYNFITGPDAAGLLNRLADKTQVLDKGEVAPLCSGTILNDEAFQRDIDHSSMFSFAYNSTDYAYYALRVNVLRSEVKRHPEEFLCDAFITDLNQLSVEDLIAKYGTHVLMGALTGMSVRSVSRTSVLYEDDPSSTDWKTEVAEYFGRWARWEIHVPSTIVSRKNLYEGKYCGGTTSVTFAGGDASLLSSVQTDGFEDWMQKRCTLDNAALLKILDAPVPLYELVSDETKAEALRTATREYLANNKLTSMETKLLVQTWTGGYYRYGTTYDNIRDGGVCGIFVNQQSGMIPLYAYSTESSFTVFTEAMAVDKSILSDKGTELLGYIYATQQPGTVPLYLAQVDGSVQSYCTLADSSTYGEHGIWEKTDILGYVIPPTLSDK